MIPIGRKSARSSCAPSQPRRFRQSDRLRPSFEWLERRELLATVDLGGIRFDSANFTVIGTDYSIAQGGTAAVGLTPAAGKTFVPLAQINLQKFGSSLSFDTSDAIPTFQMYSGEIDSVVQGGPVIPIYQSADSSAQTFDVAQLLSANGYSVSPAASAPLTVAKLTFTPSTLIFANGPGGDTSQSEIQLQGTLAPPALGNFGWGGLTLTVNGGNYVHLNSSGVSLDGASLSTNAYTFSMFGLTAAVTPTVSYSAANSDAFTFGGTATLTSKPQTPSGKSALSQVGAGLSLKIQDGGVVALSFSITGTVSILGLQFATDSGNPLKFAYNFASDQYQIQGGLTTTFNNGNSSVDLNLGYANNPSDPGIVIQDGVLQQFNATFNGNLSIAGAQLTTNNNSLTFSYDAAKDQYEMYGGTANAALTLNLANSRSISVFLGDSAEPGLVVKDGSLQSVNMGVSGQFSLAGMAVRAQDAALQYSKDQNGDDQYMLSGTLSVTGIFDASLSLGTQAQPGIVIQNNDFQLDSISIDLGRANLGAFTIRNLEVAYSKSNGDYTISGGATLVFPAGWSVGGSFSVLNGKIDELGLSYTAAGIEGGIPIGPTGLSLVSMSGMVSNLDNPANIVVTASVGVVYGEEITILGKSAAIFAATGTVTVDKDEFILVADAYFGAYGTATSFQGIIGQGSATIDLDWGAEDYSADLELSLFDGTFQIDASFQMDTTANIIVSAKAIVAMPKDVPFIGGKTLGSLDFLLEYHAHGAADGGPTGFAAGWAEVDVFGKHDFGVKYDMITKDFSIIGTNAVNKLTSTPTPGPSVYYYNYQVNVPADATTGTLGVQFTPEGGTQSISISTDGSTYIDQSAFTSANNLSLAPTLNSVGQITVDTVGSSTDPTVSLTASTYYVRLTSTIQFTSTDQPVFTSSFSYPKPTVAIAVGTPPSGSAVVPVTFATTVPQGFQAVTTVSLYYDTDGSGYNGTIIQGKIPLAALANGIQFDTGNLLFGTYYLYASLDDGTDAPVLSAYSPGVLTPVPAMRGGVYDGISKANLSGFTVYIDVDGDGQYNPGTDPATTSGPAGFYQFTSETLSAYLTSGNTYNASVIVPSGYQADPSTPPTFSFEFSRGYPSVPYYGFGLDKLASIGGIIYDDLNQDGEYNPIIPPFLTDPVLPGVTVYIDANGNGQFDQGETTATSNNSGAYSFDNIVEGTTLAIRLIVPSTSFQTGPAGGFYSIDVTNIPPTDQILGNDFGLIKYSTISGSVTGYALVNNQLAPSTAPLQGWTVNLMSGSTVVATTTSAADGSYNFYPVKPGSYTVAQVPPSGWSQTIPVSTQLNFNETAAPVGISYPDLLATGDFDGDGNLDYVVGSSFIAATGTAISVLYGNGDGTFNNANSPTGFTLPSNPDWSLQAVVSVVALNSNLGGKNLPDLAVLVSAIPNQNGMVYFLANTGTRGASQFTVMPSLTITTPAPFSLQMIAANITGDGVQDLAISYQDYSTGVLFWTAKTRQAYNQTLNYIYDGSPQNDPVAAANMAVGDINGDGYQDLVVLGGNGEGDLTIIYGDGTGGANGALPMQTITLQNISPNALAVGDINNDGAPDVVIVGAVPSNGGLNAEYILNAGGKFSEDSTSAAYLAFPPGHGGDFVQSFPVIGDVNGDGLLDVIIADEFDENTPLAVYTNSGNPTVGNIFDAPTSYPLGNSVASQIGAVVILDVNGDGFSDLIVSDTADQVIHTLFNRTVVTPGVFTVVITPDVDSAGNTFINAQVGQLGGSVFTDLNRSGTQEPAEVGAAGVALYVDLNGNGMYDASDPTTTTNAAGLYAFAGLPAGLYRLGLVSTLGKVITTPGLGTHSVTIPANGSGSARNFGIDASLIAMPLELPPGTPVGETARFQVQTSVAAASRSLRFTLEPGAPTGATIDPKTGIVTWRTTASVLPGVYAIGVRVHDMKTPKVTEVANYTVTILATYAAPVVTAISDATIDEFATLRLVVSAADPSLPPGPLTYRLDPSSPSSARIDPTTGAISWLAAVAPGAYPFTVIVANAARPDLVTSRSFRVNVQNVGPFVSHIPATALPVGGVFTTVGSFVDPGLGGWTATVDYGDGTGAVPLSLAADHTFQLSHQYANAGNFVATIVVRDAFGGVGAGLVNIAVSGPPALARVIIGDETPQRSSINSLKLVFTGPVSIGPGAFALLGPRDRVINLTAVISTTADGNTIATIAFSGPGTNHGSLLNGKYRLFVRAGRVVDSFHRVLGGKPGLKEVARFRRVQGDLNGDGRVDRAEKAHLQSARVTARTQGAAPQGPKIRKLVRS